MILENKMSFNELMSRFIQARNNYLENGTSFSEVVTTRQALENRDAVMVNALKQIKNKYEDLVELDDIDEEMLFVVTKTLNAIGE